MKRLLYKNVRAYDCEVPSPSGGGINVHSGFGVEGNYFTSLCEMGLLKEVSDTELLPDKILKVHYTADYKKEIISEPLPPKPVVDPPKREPLPKEEPLPKSEPVVEKIEEPLPPEVEEAPKVYDPIEGVRNHSLEETMNQIADLTEVPSSNETKHLNKMNIDELRSFAKEKYGLVVPTSFSKKEIIKLLKVRMP